MFYFIMYSEGMFSNHIVVLSQGRLLVIISNTSVNNEDHYYFTSDKGFKFLIKLRCHDSEKLGVIRVGNLLYYNKPLFKIVIIFFFFLDSIAQFYFITSPT